jgi:hypothetical protein
MKSLTLLSCAALLSVTVTSCCSVCSKPPVTAPKPPEEGGEKRIGIEDGPETAETCPELGDGYNSFPKRDPP